jgi:hypothetical protein
MTINQLPLTQAEALHWILVNRRPEVAFDTALDTLRQAMMNDPQAQNSLDVLAMQWRDHQRILSCIPVQPTD